MAGTTSFGSQSKIIFEPGASAHTFDSSSERYDFLGESLKKRRRFMGNGGLRGTRSRAVERRREGAYYIFGNVQLNPSPQDFETLLIHMLGNNEATGTYSLAEDLDYFGILIDRDYDTFEYSDCKVNRWILHGRAPGFGEGGEPDLMTLNLEIYGKDETQSTAWPAPEPALGTAAVDAPYVFQDTTGAITLVAAARECEEFWIYGHNFLEPRFANSQTAVDICPRDRVIGFRGRFPWNSNTTALYDTAAAGATASVVFTNGAFSTTFTFGRLSIPNHTPTVSNGKGQVPFMIDGEALKVSTTDELVVVNDNTP